MYTMKCRSVGNPDHAQYAPVSDSKVIYGENLIEIRTKALEYIGYWELGGGNWPNCIVKFNEKKVGYMSYNGRFWRGTSKDWSTEKEIKI